MRSGTLAWILGAGGAFLVACVVPRPTPPAVIEVRTEVDRFYRAVSASDWSALRDFFWPDATVSIVTQPPGEDAERVVVLSIEAFLARMEEDPSEEEDEAFDMRLLGCEVTVSGDMAVVWACREQRSGEPGAPEPTRGTEVFTWMRHRGRWRIVSSASGGPSREEARAR